MKNKNYKNDPNWLGFVLLNERELHKVDDIKGKTLAEYGDVSFELLDSPSSGEIFTRFYELHAAKR
ncbi:hypothetical protein [Paenibacillus sp. FSL H7-0331]|uniref:hypothetical protein n=1 Tax=Paenibacillus sp. FSL H7-0331 TaxID=1920421 RepID=UPI00096FE638|nr:hypothetical protein [Paenibacillus sp. FSL H7-0331]OME97326.1 hypothetical protein BK127_40920 [Paenibacillus sp. FSL H7-0331]